MINYKKIFIAIAISLSIGLPLLSFNYGISADERFHTVWGKICYDFYKSGGKDTTALVYDFKDGGKIIYYGPSVDLFTEFIMDVFKIDRTQYMFELKHFIDALLLCLMIIIGALLAVFLAGWRAGVFTLILFLAYPRIIGDGMNNPKDAVFACFYIVAIYNILKIIAKLPNPDWRNIFGAALGFGFALGNRVGAAILLFYFALFAWGYIDLNKGLFKSIKANAKQVLIKLTVFLVLGYSLGVVFWPYAFVSPISHVTEALQYFTNQPYKIKTLFEGSKISSLNLPWYYIFKWIIITAPEITLLGFLLLIIFICNIKKAKANYFLYCLLFAFLFPIVYVIYKKSGLYNGIRHMAFVIPVFVILAALGIDLLYTKLKNATIKIVFYVLFLASTSLPLFFMVKNHPFELCYFNDISGGVKNAYGKFDTDYFGNTLKTAIEWLLKNEKITSNTKIAINFPPFSIDYYIQKSNPKLSSLYVRYTERDATDYDYYIVNTALLSPETIQNNSFISKNTIKTIAVNDVPMSIIIKRADKNDYYGKHALDSGKFSEAIVYLNKALQYDPNNELVWLNLAVAQLNTKQMEQAVLSFQNVLAISPENINAMNGLAYACVQANNINQAVNIFNKIINQNPDYPEPYRILAQLYHQQGNNALAQQYISQYQQMIATMEGHP